MCELLRAERAGSGARGKADETRALGRTPNVGEPRELGRMMAGGPPVKAIFRLVDRQGEPTRPLASSPLALALFPPDGSDDETGEGGGAAAEPMSGRSSSSRSSVGMLSAPVRAPPPIYSALSGQPLQGRLHCRGGHLGWMLYIIKKDTRFSLARSLAREFQP